MENQSGGLPWRAPTPASATASSLELLFAFLEEKTGGLTPGEQPPGSNPTGWQRPLDGEQGGVE